MIFPAGINKKQNRNASCRVSSYRHVKRGGDSDMTGKVFRPLKILLAAGACLLHIATTFVIRENGVEVGRWEESDGSQEVKTIENNPPPAKAKPVPIEPGKPVMGGVGYQWSDPVIPEGEIAQWKVSGRVIDILTLAGAGPGEITFTYGKIKTTLKILATGAFHGSIPQVKGKSCTISVNVPGYSTGWVDLRKAGDFAAMPYTRRLQMRDGIPQWAAISKTTYDMEIGLSPLRLTAEQNEAYKKHLQEVVSGGDVES